MLDHHIARRLTERRTEVGLSREELAHAVAIPTHHLSKWETKGAEIPAALLWQIALVLEVEIAYFFEGLPMN